VDRQMPSEREALVLLRKRGCSEDVIRHCKAVAKLAGEMAERCREKRMNVDADLVKVGALLHDIGRSKTHSVDHAIIGAEIGRSLRLSPQIISVIERHIGGGITADEAEQLGWPNKDYIPQTIEEKIVAYADKLIEGSKEVSVNKTIQEFEKNLGPNHPAVERLKKLHEEMSVILENES